ncbi:hypothetical protein C1646_255536 [Rhizophagus diaphanus]|nr:hypothetical protein C1646_255536 [Rhizophagus diaphanus] [Rhizophagus sp. MUCL 43196]
MDDNNLKQKEKDNDEELKSFSPILDSSFDSSESISGKLEYNFISTLTPDDFSGNKNKIRKSTSPNKLGLQKKDNKVNGNINHKRLIFKKRERPRKQKSKVDKISMNITHNTPGTSQSTSDVPEASQDNYVPYLQETIRRYLTNEEPPLLPYFPITINGTPDMPGTSQAFCEEPLLIPFTSLNTNAISNVYFNDSDLFTEVSNSIFWSNALEARLCELYMKDDVVDIFWGQPVENHLIGSTNWHVYKKKDLLVLMNRYRIH